MPSEGQFLTHSDALPELGMSWWPALLTVRCCSSCPALKPLPAAWLCSRNTWLDKTGMSHERVGESGHFRCRRDTEKLDFTLATSNWSQPNATCHTP